MNNRKPVLLLVIVMCAAVTQAEDVGFMEQFSLAKDRSVALKQLIPGTRDYYYYHCLYYQHTGDFAKVHETLDQWIKRYGYTSRVCEMCNRQALLEYDENPESSLAHIKKELNLLFDHQKQDPTGATHYPTSLDQKVIDRETLKQEAFSNHSNLDGFEDSGLEFLVKEGLESALLRNLLSRLKRPDHPGLAGLVVGDLKHEHSGGFGSLEIHKLLLLAQLDECLEHMPELIGNTDFINTYLARLRPSADVNWEYDPDEKEAYLARLWEFVKRLPASQNSLKAHVLFHRLSLDCSRGVYDKERFMEYVKLPRDAYYVNEVYLKAPERVNNRADLDADFKGYTMLVSVRTDEPLVRRYLASFLKDAESFDEYLPYFEHDYLKETFAETKIVNGIGDMERWYSLLPPERYSALRERVDLEFVPANRHVMAVNDPVVLRLAIKNVPTLIIRTYEINTANYYRENTTEPDTDIDLYGLVANRERIVKYDEVPLRRHVEEFAFPEIDGPGAFVVEFIGNGHSGRALIRKGRLTFTQRMGSAGHVFTVYDEENRKLDDARLWLAGHEYEAGKNGEIVVPFSNEPGRQKIVISHGDFSAVHWFGHESEKYSFTAGIHIGAESLVQGDKCRVLVRPELCLNGEPVDIRLLEDVTLTIRCVDRDNITSMEKIQDFKLHNDRESVHEFTVPERLASISVTVKGAIENLSGNAREDVSDSSFLRVNAIEATENTECLHLRHIEGNYVLSLLGKTGEVKAGRPVSLELKHRDFKEPVKVMLQTDGQGRIALGPLNGVESVSGKGPEGISMAWFLVEECHSYAGDVHGRAGELITVPYMGGVPENKRDAVSLLEVREGAFVRDCLDSVSFEEGFVVIGGLAAGDYDLLMKESGEQIHLRLTNGRREGRHLLSRDRFLETRNIRPLQIVGVDTDEEEGKLRIRLANAGESARVHVVATRFVPFGSIFMDMGSLRGRSLYATGQERAISRFDSGRTIGEEYRYILERKYSAKFPGNMLMRPSLLISPWSPQAASVRSIRSSVHMRGVYGSRSPGARGGLMGRYGGGSAMERGSFANFDFLPSGSLVLSNLRPDENCVVTVDMAGLGPRRQLHVVALDRLNTVYRELSLSAAPEKYRDLSLKQAMDPEKHYTEHRSISALKKGEVFVTDDISTSEFEVYDSLVSIHALFMTLTRDIKLGQFGFILQWPDTDAEEKRRLYSKYACHELNFFLFKKDPDFFKSVILPFLASKKDKTFMDHWLLGSDVSPYAEHWSYMNLNVVERILLAQRVQAEQAATLRYVNDFCDRTVQDVEKEDRLFDTALKRSALVESVYYDRALPTFVEIEEPEPIIEGLVEEPAAAVDMETGDEDLDGFADGDLEEPSMIVPGAEDDMERRGRVRQFYRKMGPASMWVENNYYGLRAEEQGAALVGINRFWRDYAACPAGQEFVSTHVAEATLNFTEMMFALAVLDLPFESAEHDVERAGAGMRLEPASPAVVFHKQVKETAKTGRARPLLISQGFFALDDRYEFRNNEPYDKLVTREFLGGRVYGCRVVLTNPTSSRRKVDVLLQIPQGAIPVKDGFYTRGEHREISPYSTEKIEYFFYFPAGGEYPHYPVHVAENEDMIACADPLTFNVVEVLTETDKSSWRHVSQNGSESELVKYLQDNNIGRLDLDLIAFRMRDGDAFREVTTLLRARHEYNDALWSYGLLHNDVAVIREYLQYSPFAEQCGAVIASRLLTIDPVKRGAYEHREFYPLVNARTGRVAREPCILNADLLVQYRRLLECLRYKPELDSEDLLAVTYYMFLQDRVEEGLAFFDRVNPGEITERLQYDYLKAYAAFYREKPDEARRIAEKYRDYPVERWCDLFRGVLAQVEEMEGGPASVVDKEDMAQVQTGLADTDVSLDLKIENRRVLIQSQNLEVCRVNYYLIDIEFLFSRDPFVQELSGPFAIIRPNEWSEVRLSKGGKGVTLDLPKKFRNSNVVVEIVGGGMTRRRVYYPHSLDVQIMENYGQLRVEQEESGNPVAKAYVKVYARDSGGETTFYKDGYTDLRGRFDYASLNTDQISNVERFAILILSEREGAVVREAAPPKM